MGFHSHSCHRGCHLAVCRMDSGLFASRRDYRRDFLPAACRRGSHMACRRGSGLGDLLIGCARLPTCLHCSPRDRDDPQRAGLHESLRWYMRDRHWGRTFCWIRNTSTGTDLSVTVPDLRVVPALSMVCAVVITKCCSKMVLHYLSK